jgi:hypothetical protein
MSHDVDGREPATARERSRNLGCRRAPGIEQDRLDPWPQ